MLFEWLWPCVGNTLGIGSPPQDPVPSGLEQRRKVIAQRIAQLGDLRPGSITSTSGRCGKPHCRCHQPGQPGHGPNVRLIYKVNGKTVSEA